MLFACGEDREGEAVLSAARREAARSSDRAGMARVEIGLADGAVARDNDARAHGHLAAARHQIHPVPKSIAARAWIVEARLARAEGRPAPPWLRDDPDGTDEELVDPSERMDLGAELALERAIAARLAHDWAGARSHLERARELATHTSSPRLIALVEVEIGLYTAEVDDPAAAYARIRHAIEVLGSAGLRRDEGRAMIRLAEMMSSKRVESEHDSAPLWLGRAKAALGDAATWRDRSAIRTGFRAHGRRLFDRVMTEETAARIESFERARGALLSAISVSVEAAECALNDLEVQTAGPPDPRQPFIDRVREAALSMSSAISPAVGEVDKVVHDLIDLIAAALVERDRLRNLLNALSDVDAATDRDALPPLVAQVAARILEADHVVVALAKDGQLEPAGRWGSSPPGAHERWKSIAAGALKRERAVSIPASAGPTTRRDAQPAGPTLVVPMRASDVDGVIYADKLARNGQFREQDEALAFLLAEYSAIALGRLRAREQEHLAVTRLAITLDAIRDGVLAVDGQGVILSANAALDRMLRTDASKLVGARVEQVPALAALWSVVSAAPRLDGAVVRMPTGNFVVSTRALQGSGQQPGVSNPPEETSGGVVTTLVELDRAQKIAQRIGASRPRYGFQDVVGSSPSLLRAVAIARQAASVDSTVLITGESGTGKEIIAQAIHTSGARAAEPFVGLNVAALPRELLEAELFGYERGAFTGARSEGNLGKFELAGTGTILLDEIGEMPLDMQAKLLRVLQERVVVRLGGSVERPVHARVMATTHRDLAQLVDEGKFRMDLLYRLRVLSIELPSLRERPEDIAVLAQHYLLKFAEQQRKRVVEMGPRVYDELSRYDWPGNIRELANVMEAEVSLLAPDITELSRLATRLVGRFRGTSVAGSTGEFRASAPSTGEFRAVEPVPFSPLAPIVPLAEIEKKAYLHALDKCNQSVARAAEALGVSKVTFYAKLRSYGMHPKDRFDDEGPTSVRRQRAADARMTDPDIGPPSQNQPFEPPTRTSQTKIPNARDDRDK
jgi:transcriptional regulator with PAS, ATPase and Fis domain